VLNYILIIGGAILALLTANLSLQKLKQRDIKSWSIVFLAIILIVIGIVRELENNAKEIYSNDFGVIDGSFKSKQITYPSVSLGNPKSIYQLQNNDTIGELINGTGIRVWLEDRKLYINALVKDENGVVIAKIERNEWQLARIGAIIFDRNFDNHGIEIKDGKDRVVLQINFDGEKVNICGIFIRTPQPSLAFYACYNQNEEGSCLLITTRPDTISNIISPIFKYPSGLHQGERVSSL
jgi:hypothetical protein